MSISESAFLKKTKNKNRHGQAIRASLTWSFIVSLVRLSYLKAPPVTISARAEMALNDEKSVRE